MAFESFRVSVGNTETDIIECPATQEGAAVLQIGNRTGSGVSCDILLYKQSLDASLALVEGFEIDANEIEKIPAPISLKAGDKIVMIAAEDGALTASGTFTHSGATPAAVGFTGRGEWSDSSIYVRNDVVEVGGASYLALQGSTNENPETQTAFWMLLADRGPPGEMTGPDGAVAGNLPAFDDATGKVLADSGIPAADVLTNDDVADDSDVFEATEDKVFTTDKIESASASVSLSDAGTVAVDWEAGINFSLTVEANRTIGNPTNGQPGTWRSIIVQGNNSTERTLSFGNQYGGVLPVIEDCNNAKWYELVIRCVTATHFLVSARDASPP